MKAEQKMSTSRRIVYLLYALGCAIGAEVAVEVLDSLEKGPEAIIAWILRAGFTGGYWYWGFIGLGVFDPPRE